MSLFQSQFMNKSLASNIHHINLDQGIVMFTNKFIGEGANGKIYQGRIHYGTDQEQIVAIKVIAIPRQEQLRQKLQKELTIAAAVEHPNIVKYYNVEETCDSYYIVMDYCQEGTLQQMINLPDSEEFPHKTKVLDEKFTVQTCAKLIQALYYLSRVNIYGKGLAHRDIKPDNIVFQNQEPKFIDFGLARAFNENISITKKQGTPYYMSPLNLISNQYNAEKNDVWSFGVLMFQMLQGTFPWRREVYDEPNLELAHSTMKLRFDNISEDVKDLISKMLILDENQRWGWSQIIRHPALSQYVGEQLVTMNKVDEIRNIFETYEIARNLIFSQMLRKTSIQDNSYAEIIKQMDNLIINIVALELTTHKELIGKNTDNEVLYNKIIKAQITNTLTSQLQTELQVDLEQLLRKFVRQIYRKGNQKENSFIGFVATVNYWLTFQGTYIENDLYLEKFI